MSLSTSLVAGLRAFSRRSVLSLRHASSASSEPKDPKAVFVAATKSKLVAEAAEKLETLEAVLATRSRALKELGLSVKARKELRRFADKHKRGLL
jgi:hypothetical protein